MTDIAIFRGRGWGCTECSHITNKGEDMVMLEDPLADHKYRRWLCPDCVQKLSDEDKIRLIKFRMTT